MGSSSPLKPKHAMGAVLVLMLISGVKALSCPESRQPVVRFIDFYIAAQKADAPKLTFWERVVYGLALAKPDKRIRPLNEAACRR